MLLVNDGSKDATGEVLDRLAPRAPGPDRRAAADAQPRQGGGGARRGCAPRWRRAPRSSASWTPICRRRPREIDDLLAALARPGVQVAIGARIGMLGYDIERSAVRHYLGRVFATAASLILRARVYDTQCGAKLFRAGPALADALATPFLSRWAFDVEFLGRLLIGTPAVPPLPLNAIVEVPLPVWHDVKGSKLRLWRDGAHAARSGAGRERHGGPPARDATIAKILRRSSVFARRIRLADPVRGG